MSSKSAALVTGGSGFLGKCLVQHLLDTGSYEVWIFDVAPPSPAIPGAQFISGDLTSSQSISKACNGKDVVFHVATAAPTAQNASSAKALMQAVNVDGMRNVISACETAKVSRLVVTSSASVVFDGSPLRTVDETLPYADPPLDYYTSTKAQAEEIALIANVPGLSVCALRPSGIFGPGDRLAVPAIASRAKAGKMKYMIGDGSNMFDWTYVDNVAHAHILADVALQMAGSPAAGQAFFITNDEPMLFWGFMGDVCEGLGYGRPYINLPVWLMMIVAVVAVWAGRLLGSTSEINPTRVRLSSVERTFNCEKAKRLLGYAPKVDMKTAIGRTLESLPHLHKDFDDASKKNE